MKNNHENDVLLKALEADAIEQSSRIVKAAEDAAAEMLSQADIDVKTFETESVAALRAGLEREAVVRLSSARMLAKAVSLQARQDVIEEVLAAVVRRVSVFDVKDRAELILSLYESLKAEWTLDEPFVVCINPDDAGLIQDNGVEVRHDATVTHGVVFSTKDGKVRYENTVASRIKMMRSNLVPLINKSLFDGMEQG